MAGIVVLPCQDGQGSWTNRGTKGRQSPFSS